MKGLKIANRYAQSLIELAEENGITEPVLNDMKVLLKTVNENREFLLFLNSPIINPDKKNNVFNKLFGDFQELSLKFMHLLTKNRREMILPVIAQEYIVKLNKMRGVVPMSLTAATELDKEVVEVILQKLNKKINGSIELTEKIDESLIGGFIARMGDLRIDASVSRHLNEMKKRLMY